MGNLLLFTITPGENANRMFFTTYQCHPHDHPCGQHHNRHCSSTVSRGECTDCKVALLKPRPRCDCDIIKSNQIKK